jgi:hypothetical protein
MPPPIVSRPMIGSVGTCGTLEGAHALMAVRGVHVGAGGSCTGIDGRETSAEDWLVLYGGPDCSYIEGQITVIIVKARALVESVISLFPGFVGVRRVLE